MKPKRVAVLGWMYSGKGTFADVLVKEAGFGLVNFGDSVKADCCVMLNQAIARVTGKLGTLTVPQMERDKHMFRVLYQWYSDTFHKDYLGDYYCWVNKTRPNIEAYLDEELPIVVADVRYKEEYEALANRGFHFFRVVRPEAERRAQGIELYGGVDEWEKVSNAPGEHKIDDYPAQFVPGDDVATVERFARLLVG